ncbi:hypothetical protein Ancab_001027 [Ancistrocladus abbreviatus]
MASSVALVTDACGWFNTAFLTNIGMAIKRYKNNAIYAISATMGVFLFGLALLDGSPLGLMLIQKFDTIAFGLVQLAAYGFCKDSQIITDELFTLAMLTMITFTGILVPVIKYLYVPLNKIPIFYLADVLQGKARFVSLFSSSMSLLAIKKAILASTSQPNKSSLNRSYSECIVNAFSIFEKQNEDIVKWGIDGTVDASHLNIKKVNRNVMLKAPCSLGVLIDRGNLVGNRSVLMGQSMFSFAMLFLGVDDDHKALAYSRRMEEDPDVNLNSLDTEIIQDFWANAENRDNIAYKETLVDDGIGTTSIARSLEKQVDLVLVGRGHEPDLPTATGPSEWNECPEIGAMGDMLATWDFRFSVLAVQPPPRRNDFYCRQLLKQSFESKVSYDSYIDELT